ncbi:MAG: flagellar hook-associated protein FlgK [Candidatus Margulisbacteria bacterium]|nr:flagellar hook-associated protein FlgK [Candidatus Margulisiibacteriota bacterium]
MVSNGIEIAKRSLAAQRYAMDVIGHNLANVNTEGYSRQQVVLQTTNPILIPVINKNKPLASLGTGVMLTQIERIRDDFLDSQRRGISNDKGTWDQQYTNYDMIQGIFNEPSDTGIAANMTKFWDAWQNLATPDPSSAGARSNLVSQARVLAGALQQTRTQLVDLQKNNNTDIGLKVARINDLADQIAVINGQIVESKASGDANDLEDKRNVLVGEMSQLVNMEYYVDTTGSSTIAIGGSFIVADRNTNHLAATIDTNNYGYNKITWEENGKSALINGGELYGLIKSRDENVAGYIDNVDTFAAKLIETINNQHKAGFDLKGAQGGSFFTGTDASDIKVNEELINDPSRVAASSRNTDSNGNGENAIAIAQIRNSLTMNSNSTTLDEFYQNMISNLGTTTAETQTYSDINAGLLSQVDKQIVSTSGVSIDEEMSELIKTEQAYQSAAKYMQAVQDTMDTLLKIV